MKNASKKKQSKPRAFAPFTNLKLKLPTIDNAKIWFISTNGVRYEGMWIEQEKMFFIGYEQLGDFLFSRQVSNWGYI